MNSVSKIFQFCQKTASIRSLHSFIEFIFFFFMFCSYYFTVKHIKELSLVSLFEQKCLSLLKHSNVKFFYVNLDGICHQKNIKNIFKQFYQFKHHRRLKTYLITFCLFFNESVQILIFKICQIAQFSEINGAGMKKKTNPLKCKLYLSLSKYLKFLIIKEIENL